jgi:hypothetical protein
MAINTDQAFIGGIPFFLNAVLSTPAGALPKGPLWVVVIDFDDNLRNTIKNVSNYEPRMPDKWSIDRALNTITSARYQSEKGCVLSQSVSLPGEALITNVDGLQYNGFIRSRVGAGRQDFEPLRIGFLNTNVNFVDNVIRPWVVMTGHLGFIARPASEKYRTTITLYKLGIKSIDTAPFILQKYSFWGCCPVNTGSEEYTYAAEGVATTKSADFIYQWYTTSSENNYFANQSPGPAYATPAIARAVNPRAPIEIRRALPVSAPGPYDEIQ